MLKIYILHVEELKRKARQEWILAGLNLQRREKVCKCLLEKARLLSLGAGALLWYGVSCYLEEQSHGAGFVQDSDCAPFMVSWEMLERQLQKPYVESHMLETKEGPHGKPYLQHLPVFFNLSHSGDLAVCAVSDREVGVDVQKIESGNHENLWKRYFTKAEQEMLLSCAGEEEKERLFYHFWVQKEAYGKLTGAGLASSLKESPGLWPKQLGISMTEFPVLPGYCGAVCRYLIYNDTYRSV